jgi:hypothetical protein
MKRLIIAEKDRIRKITERNVLICFPAIPNISNGHTKNNPKKTVDTWKI